MTRILFPHITARDFARNTEVFMNNPTWRSLKMGAISGLIASLLIAGPALAEDQSASTLPSPEKIPASTSILARLKHLSPGTVCPPATENRMGALVSGAQITNALVVGNALHKGAGVVGVFAGGPLGLIVEQAVETYVIHVFTRHASCGTRNVINAGLAGSALLNASQSGVK